MIEIKKLDDNEDCITMAYLLPCQIAQIVDKRYPAFIGHIVMRTQSSHHFEVIDFSNWYINAGWTTENNIKVKLIDDGDIVNLRINNKPNREGSDDD